MFYTKEWWYKTASKTLDPKNAFTISIPIE
jgi:hypothetical protein